MRSKKKEGAERREEGGLGKAACGMRMRWSKV